MSAARWFLIPAMCAAIACGAASTALADGKHHAAKPAAGKTVKKPVAMSKTHATPKKHKPAVKKNRKSLKPASHSVKRSVPKSQLQPKTMSM
ncbi:MAG: hypothetical protein ABSE73_13650 [Planctomycetota bacterium]